MATKFDPHRENKHRKDASMNNGWDHEEPTSAECFKILDDMGLASRYGIRLHDGKLTHDNKDGFFLS